MKKMEKKQTAIEWLVEQIKSDQNQKTLSASEWMQVIEQAKQMEKEQSERMYSEEDMISFAHFYFQEEFNSTMQTSKSTDEIFKKWFEQYYNETYGK